MFHSSFGRTACLAVATALIVFVCSTVRAQVPDAGLLNAGHDFYHEKAENFFKSHKCLTPENKIEFDLIVELLLKQATEYEEAARKHHYAAMTLSILITGGDTSNRITQSKAQEEDMVAQARSSASILRGDAAILKRIPPCVIEAKPAQKKADDKRAEKKKTRKKQDDAEHASAVRAPDISIGIGIGGGRRERDDDRRRRDDDRGGGFGTGGGAMTPGR